MSFLKEVGRGGTTFLLIAKYMSYYLMFGSVNDSDGST